MSDESKELTLDAMRPRLEAFLRAELGEPVQILSGQRFPSGLSWLTFAIAVRVGDGSRAREEELILRVGDPGGLLAPYRAAPEYRVLSALANVPGLVIPQTIAFSDDSAVLGAPFMVTSRVMGDTPGPWTGVLLKSPEMIASLAQDFATNLIAIHGFDWRASDLPELWGNPSGADVARLETEIWANRARVSEGGNPQLYYARRWLLDRAPPCEKVTIVHGDYRVGNFLQHEGRITAILDWELVHVGDPHEDLAWMAARTFAAGTDKIGGLFDKQEMYRRYSEATGLVVQPKVLHYYEVLAQFKMAAMLVGATTRVELGHARDVRVAAMAFQLGPTLAEVNRLIGAAS